MKLRHSTSQMTDKVEMQMTPMIDIVFQLLTFFLFSFKIVALEGDFNIRMPVAGPTNVDIADPQLPIKIRLTADAQGNLVGIQMGDRKVPTFQALHEQVMGIVGNDAGPGAAEKAEAELDCDYNLKYQYVIAAVTALSGYITPDGRIVKLIQKIKFSPPKKAAAPG